MWHWLHAIAHFFVWLWQQAVGDRLNTGWGIIAMLYVGVVLVSFVVGGIRSVVELSKAVDIGFNKQKLENYNLRRPPGTAPRKIVWAKVRIQQVQSVRFTIPLGILAFVSLYWWVRESFTFAAYAWLAVGWLLFLLVLRVWWIATAVWTDRKLTKSGERPLTEEPPHGKSVLWAVRHYLNWGLQKSTVKRPPYIGLLRLFNPFIKLFGLRWLQIRLVRPLVICAIYACLWGVTMMVAPFYLNHELDTRRPLLKPEWASRYAKEPTYGSEAIPDTPGDAQAALG